MPTSTRPPGYALLANVLLCVFFFSGILFGWAPIQTVLLAERGGKGQFSELCPHHHHDNATAPPCDEQLAHLNLVYTLGTFTLSLVSLPGGWFLDTAGVRATVALSAVLEIAGLVLFGISDSQSADLFIPGAICMSAGGFLIMVAAFPAAFLYPRFQTAILAAISCLFDASSLTFAIFQNVSFLGRAHLFCGYAAFAGVLFGSLLCLWSSLGTRRNASSSDDELPMPGDEDDDYNDAPAVNEEPPALAPDGVAENMHARSVLRQLRSFEFVFIVIFASIQQLRANFYIGNNNELLHRYGDHDGWYTRVFGYALPAGIVFIPIIDATVERLGLIGALHTTNFMGVAYGSLALVANLPLQYAVFGFFTGFRAFLYSVMSTFNAQVFGLNTLGRMTGFVFTSSAMFQLLQYPLTDLVNLQFKGDPFWPCLGLVVATVPVALLLFVFQCRWKRQQLRPLPASPGLLAPPGGDEFMPGQHLEDPLLLRRGSATSSYASGYTSPLNNSRRSLLSSMNSDQRSLYRSPKSFLRSPSRQLASNVKI